MPGSKASSSTSGAAIGFVFLGQDVKLLRNKQVAMCSVYEYNQGRIEPPKAARGHATHIDGIVLNVTKFRIQIVLCLALSVGPPVP